MQIQLGGETRELDFTMYAVEEFSKKVDFTNTRSEMYACIYAGLKAFEYAENPRKEFPYSYRQVIKWCDEIGDEELVKAHNEFTATSTFKTWYEKFQTLLRTKVDEDKKKATVSPKPTTTEK